MLYIIYIAIIGVIKMNNSELDKIKTTITISLGTKNRLRKNKGSNSYEKYINYLIRLRDQTSNGENLIELQKFIRKQAIYSIEQYKILFEYNRFNNSPNFIFDIKINIIREAGKIITLKEFFANFSPEHDLAYKEYALYFRLLETAIQNEIEPLFKHNGRFEDHFSWQNEYKLLNLSEKSFEEDVMDKLKSYKYGESAF